MTPTAVAAGAEVAGASGAELTVMREAAARLGLPAPDAAAVFGALAVPFTAHGEGHGEGRSNYNRTGGHHWCTAAER